MMVPARALLLVACLAAPAPTSSFSAPLRAALQPPRPATPTNVCAAHEAAASRRAFLAAAAGAALSLPLASRAEEAAKPAAPAAPSAAEDVPVLTADKLYSGPTAYGFAFKYPASWKVNKRVGNKHLYDLEVRPKDGGGVLGVTIDTVKISTISELGPLDEIAERVRAEQQRASKGVEVEIASKQEKEQQKMKYYIIATSTGKTKRYVKMAATAEQLFTFSVTIPASRIEQLEGAALQALNSFKVQPNTMENFQVYGKNQAPEVVEFFRKLPQDFARIESGDF